MTEKVLKILSVFLGVFVVSHSFALTEDRLQSIDITSSCSTESEKVDLVIHLTTRDPSVRSPKGLDSDQSWLLAQLQEANTLFSEIGICFRVASILSLPKSESTMSSRIQRTQLGRGKERLHHGKIDVFIVNRLEDVDVKGAEIRGVHWRDPRNKESRRWIILSRIARSKVLAHELGHYFDLPHSTYPESIMNKTPRPLPPMKERGFVETEYSIMKRAWGKMKRSSHLVVFK